MRFSYLVYSNETSLYMFQMEYLFTISRQFTVYAVYDTYLASTLISGEHDQSSTAYTVTAS